MRVVMSEIKKKPKTLKKAIKTKEGRKSPENRRERGRKKYNEKKMLEEWGT